MYSEISAVYDTLMADADYDNRFKIIENLFLKYDRKPKLLLDVACGTGEFSRRFAKSGASVIGVDISDEMLSEAMQKSSGEDVLYLCQDMKSLDLYGTVDGAICCLDSFNHLESYKDFCQALKSISLFLERERLLIFDLNTPYKHKKVLGDNIFIKQGKNVYCVWQNEYERKHSRVNITLDLFINKGELYERRQENFSEIAFGKAQVKAALARAGFRIVDMLDENGNDAPTGKSERIIFVARKVK